MIELQIGKIITCTGCAQQIIGEYVVRKKNSREEYYHKQCARSAGLLELPVEIRFTEEDNKTKNDHVAKPIG